MLHPLTVLVAVALTIRSNERLTEGGEASVEDARIAAPGPGSLQAARPAATVSSAMKRFMRSSIGR